MAKYPTYKYEFEIIDGEPLLLAVGEAAIMSNGVVVKVHRYAHDGLMGHLAISLDGSAWQVLEKGRRTPNGKPRNDFKRMKMSYPAFAGNKGIGTEVI